MAIRMFSRFNGDKYLLNFDFLIYRNQYSPGRVGTCFGIPASLYLL